jgi:ABC-type multidrug transport system ATPase subunit
MTLLALERVCKRHQDGRSERVVLDDVSMSMQAGELVAVLGERRSGRSTLLRIAAEIEPPDSGVVRFAGRDLGPRKGSALGEGIGYCSREPADREAGVVLEELMLTPRTRGVSHADAQALARAALQRVGAAGCAGHFHNDLDDDGIAVLMSVSESTEFSNADRKLLIRDGVLAGSVDPELPSVHQLLAEASA